MRGLFITGTDTGVGKTFVAAAIVRRLRSEGRRVRACKPVATGRPPGRAHADDTLHLAEAAGVADDPGQVTRYSFSAPAAPPVAARQEGAAFSLEDLARAVRESVQGADAVIVEGVGGLLCPLTQTETIADLIAALQLPAVVVARRSLGTLNHTLLTVEAAQRRNLPLAGVVVCETEPPAGLAAATNVEELARRLSVPLLAVVPFQQEPSPALPAAVAAVDWWALMRP